MFKKRKEEEELKTQSANTFVETYLLLIIMKQTIKKEVTEEQWPFTFDILKDLQFSWFIMKSEWVLKKKNYIVCKNRLSSPSANTVICSNTNGINPSHPNITMPTIFSLLFSIHFPKRWQGEFKESFFSWWSFPFLVWP